jgi:hypothetical protein
MPTRKKTPLDKEKLSSPLVEGLVDRIATDNLGYVRSEESGATFSFNPRAVVGPNHKPLPVSKLRVGDHLGFALDESKRPTQLVWRGTVKPKAKQRRAIKKKAGVKSTEESAQGSKIVFFAKAAEERSVPEQSTSVTPQKVLSPTKATEGVARIEEALPPEIRKFGRILDTSNLWPGDLLLSADATGKHTISAMIEGVQAKGGYAPRHARWVHAAMYLGDDRQVVEASFEEGEVRISRLEEYYDGKSLLRFRRSRKVSQERDGWKLCICALARLKEPYDLFAVVKAWAKVYLFGIGFYNRKRENSTSDAAVCSTLYADAHNEALGTNLGQHSGMCVPATLSGSDEFVDVDARWLKIT